MRCRLNNFLLGMYVSAAAEFAGTAIFSGAGDRRDAALIVSGGLMCFSSGVALAPHVRRAWRRLSLR